jgi:hypothetical protein
LLHLLAVEVLQCGDALSRTSWRFFVSQEDMTTLRNGKLPLVRFGDGGTYEGEWLNGKKLRER